MFEVGQRKMNHSRVLLPFPSKFQSPIETLSLYEKSIIIFKIRFYFVSFPLI